MTRSSQEVSVVFEKDKGVTHTHTHTHTHSEGESGRERERERESQRETETERDRQRVTERVTERDRDRETERETQRDRQRQITITLQYPRFLKVSYWPSKPLSANTHVPHDVALRSHDMTRHHFAAYSCNLDHKYASCRFLV